MEASTAFPEHPAAVVVERVMVTSLQVRQRLKCGAACEP